MSRAEPIVVIGAAGFGRETLDVITAMIAAGADVEIAGVVDDAPSGADVARLAARGTAYLGTVEAYLEALETLDTGETIDPGEAPGPRAGGPASPRPRGLTRVDGFARVEGLQRLQICLNRPEVCGPPGREPGHVGPARGVVDHPGDLDVGAGRDHRRDDIQGLATEARGADHDNRLSPRHERHPPAGSR